MLKIDRNSIRRNEAYEPNQTRQLVGSRTECSFTFKGSDKEFQCIKIAKGVVVSSMDLSTSSFAIHPIKANGYIVNPETARWMETIRGVKMEEIEYKQYEECRPQPKYFFEYRNQKIRCSNCERDVKYSKIYKNNYCCWECPKCNAENSFGEFEYEDINDVLKELQDLIKD